MSDESTPGKKICRDCHREFSELDLAFCPEDGAPLILVQQRDDPMLGKVIDGRFEVLKIIGTGGMGNVYLAQQISVGRKVAIKFLQQDMANDGNAVKRFLKEAKALSQLTHPNAVTFHDFGQSETGLLYLVMEHVNGATLKDSLDKAGKFPFETACRVMIQLCDALAAAHHLGIVHRDLKPSNIMLARQPENKVLLKVLDFGLAKLTADENPVVTRSGVVAGTPRYMSPEQLLGEKVDKRTDIYAAGVILYEMVAGRPPFLGDTSASLAIDHVQTAPPPLFKEGRCSKSQQALENLVFRCLAKKRSERPRSATELRTGLREILTREAKARGETTVISSTIEDGILPTLPDSRPGKSVSKTGDTKSGSISGTDPTATQVTLADSPKAKANQGSPRRHKRRRLGVLAAVVIVCLLVGLLLFDRFNRAPDRPSPGVDAPTPKTLSQNPSPAIDKRPQPNSHSKQPPGKIGGVVPPPRTRIDKPTPPGPNPTIPKPRAEIKPAPTLAKTKTAQPKPQTEIKPAPTVAKTKTAQPKPQAEVKPAPTVAKTKTTRPKTRTETIVLRFTSRPASAIVFVGRKRLGRTPVSWRTSRSANRAVVTLRKAGYKGIKVRIIPRRTRSYKFALQKIVEPIRKKGDPIFQLLKKR